MDEAEIGERLHVPAPLLFLEVRRLDEEDICAVGLDAKPDDLGEARAQSVGFVGGVALELLLLLLVQRGCGLGNVFGRDAVLTVVAGG
jgi:hypothetical protein